MDLACSDHPLTIVMQLGRPCCSILATRNRDATLLQQRIALGLPDLRRGRREFRVLVDGGGEQTDEDFGRPQESIAGEEEAEGGEGRDCRGGYGGGGWDSGEHIIGYGGLPRIEVPATWVSEYIASPGIRRDGWCVLGTRTNTALWSLCLYKVRAGSLMRYLCRSIVFVLADNFAINSSTLFLSVEVAR